MNVLKTKAGLVVKTRFYSVTLSTEGGRMVSFVHAGGGTEFAAARGIANDAESGWPGKMSHDVWQQELLREDGKTLRVRFTYHGKSGFLIRWSMCYTKTFTFSDDSPLITVEQSLQNTGAPELFAEFRIHNEVVPIPGSVMILPAPERLREIPATVSGVNFIPEFTEGLAGLWCRKTKEALLFLPDYDIIAQFLLCTGKNVATVEWYCRSFNIGDNAVWKTTYRILPVSLNSPAELALVIASAGVALDLNRRDRRPQAPVSIQPGRGDFQEREASAGRFSRTVAGQVAREAAFCDPRFESHVTLPGGAVYDRVIHTRTGAGIEVPLPDDEELTVHAEVSLRETGPGETEAYLVCCDTAGKLHAVSLPVPLNFWKPTGSLCLPLGDLAGKTVRLVIYGTDVLWTSLSIASAHGEKSVFSSFRVWTEEADEPMEVASNGKGALVFRAISAEGAPRLKYRMAPAGTGAMRWSAVRMKKVPGGKNLFATRREVPVNEEIAYSVSAGKSAVRGTAIRTGYFAADSIPKGAVCFYVAPLGQDSFSGGLPKPNARGNDGPFATIGRAREAVRKLKRHGKPVKPTAIMIRGGTYALTEPLTFTPEDSGTAACPAIYMAYPGETVVISGGMKITEPWTDTGNGVWTCRLPAGRKSRPMFRQLFVNDKRMIRARIPREGFFHMGPPVDGKKTGFSFSAEDLRGCKNPAQAEMVAYYIWNETRYKVVDVDSKNGIVTLAAPVSAARSLDRYYMENIPEGLNVPGSWYFDPEQAVLCWHPEPGASPQTAAVVVPVLRELVRFQGKKGNPVRHVTLRGLTFAHADWFELDGGSQAARLIGSAISLEHAEFCCLRNNRVVNVGTYGIGLYRGCRHVMVVGNEIAHAGAGGIRVGLTEQDETTRENTVVGNAIHDCGQVYPSAVGIWIGQSSGNRLLRNTIHHLPYTGISVGWTWGPGANTHKQNRIEGNTIHHVMEVLDDGGAIYTLGISYGTTIKNNTIHHVTQGNGIYLDEGSTGIHISGNTLYRCQAGISVHGGRDNLFEHNITANHRDVLIGLSNCNSYIQKACRGQINLSEKS